MIHSHKVQVQAKLIYDDRNQNSGYLRRGWGLTRSEHKATFWAAANILCLDWGGSYENV